MIRGIITLLVVVWLVIGVVAANQRGYLKGAPATCAKAGTITATVVSGPLNYTGANPRITCQLPKPSN